MGAACSATEVVMAGKHDMPGLPAQEAEAIFRDMPGATSFVPHLKKVEFLRGKPSTVGACWLETRLWKGEELVMRKHITEMSKDPYYTVCATATTEFKPRLGTPNFIQTFTFVIQPAKDNSNGCVIKWTMAFLPTGLYSHWISKLCQSAFRKSMTQHIHEEMQCYYEEGLKRHGQLKEGSETKTEETVSSSNVIPQQPTSYPRRTVPEYLKGRE